MRNIGNSEVRLPLIIIFATALGMFLKNRIPLSWLLVLGGVSFVFIVVYLVRDFVDEVKSEVHDEEMRKSFLLYCREIELNQERVEVGMHFVKKVEVLDVENKENTAVIIWNGKNPSSCVLYVGEYRLNCHGMNALKRCTECLKEAGLEISVPDEIDTFCEWETTGQKKVYLEELFEMSGFCLLMGSIFLLILFHLKSCVDAIGGLWSLFLVLSFGCAAASLMWGIILDIKEYIARGKRYEELNKRFLMAYGEGPKTIGSAVGGVPLKDGVKGYSRLR